MPANMIAAVRSGICGLVQGRVWQPNYIQRRVWQLNYIQRYSVKEQGQCRTRKFNEHATVSRDRMLGTTVTIPMTRRKRPHTRRGVQYPAGRSAAMSIFAACGKLC